jgi:outer membrane protein OmpA-like peptidoglycan-associated protein
MRILITGSLVFLLWAVFASWFYVCKIKPNCEKPAETSIPADTIALEPSPPAELEDPKPENLVLYFDYNKSDILVSEETDQKSALYLDWLGKHSAAFLYITGHTDSKGGNEYNQSLGMKRADSTLKYLTAKGISLEKIKTESKGETEPVADNATEAGRAKNRRAEITIK